MCVLTRLARARVATIVACLFVLPVQGALAEPPAPRQPAAKEKCRVCGMFVAKYPGWVAQVSFRDSPTLFFDGPKDMFKFLFNLAKYLPEQTRQDVTAIYVTEYYDLRPIRAEDAFFVKGSDVFGPMGHELVPFASKEAALEFFQDHKGKEVFRLELITPAVITELD